MVTTAKKILVAISHFKSNPDGLILTGDWITPQWSREQFYQWFHECLNRKCSRDVRQWRKLSRDYQSNLRCDARVINDYFGKRIRHTGCRGLLRTPEMQKKYPMVNCQSAAILHFEGLGP